ncbi:MAG: flagellar motor switch protein FliG [Deltaproteobacteria bacterium]|nr:flagellar motor switch protein FliG [Deltaproteobacteria bacterium]
MTSEEKAAILLLSLDEDLAAEVMKNLNSSEIRRVGKYMNRITSITGDTLNTIAREFCLLAKEKGGTLSIGEETPRKIITKALGEKSAEAFMNEVGFEKISENPIIDKIRDLDPKVLTDFTRTEHPQTIALILAHLRTEQAAEILENFTPEMQYEITKRMATLKSVPNEFLDELAKTLEKEIVAGDVAEQQLGGVRMISEILNRMSRANENAIMSAMEDGDPELAAQIRNLMFTFEDVLQLDDRSIQELLREVSSEDLARALKPFDDGMKSKFFKNMSKRGAEMLKEDIEMMPPIRLSEVEAAQRAILDTTKRLESEGRIMILRGSEGDEFV